MVETTIIQQLNILSLEQLEEVKKAADALIKSKRRSELGGGTVDLAGSYSRRFSRRLSPRMASPVSSDYYIQRQTAEERDKLYNSVRLAVNAWRQRSNSSSLESPTQESTNEYIKFIDELVDKVNELSNSVDELSNSANSPDPEKESESLRELIGLVDEWMSDESGYDETTYPQIEAALQKNQLSL